MIYSFEMLITKLCEENSELKMIINNLEEKVAELTAELDYSEKINEELDADGADTNHRIEELKAENEGLKDALGYTCEDFIESIIVNLHRDNEIQALKKELEKEKANTRSAGATLANYMTCTDGLVEEIENRDKQIEELEELVTSTKRTCAKCCTDLATTGQLLAEKEKRISEMSEYIKKKNDEIKMMESVIAELTESVKDRDAKIKALNDIIRWNLAGVNTKPAYPYPNPWAPTLPPQITYTSSTAPRIEY